MFGDTNKNTGGTSGAAGFSFGSKLSTTTNGNESKSETEYKNADNGLNDTDGSTHKDIFQIGSSNSNGKSSTTAFVFGDKTSLSTENSNSSSIFGGTTSKPFAIKSGQFKLMTHVLYSRRPVLLIFSAGLHLGGGIQIYFYELPNYLIIRYL